MKRPTFKEATSGGGRSFAAARLERDALSPDAAAQAAWYPGHELGTVEAIKALIIRQRQDALAAPQTKQTPTANLPIAA
jgi:hypothetical protein